MPNGRSKNWIRLCAAIDGFRVRYNQWPTKIRLNIIYYESIRSLFKPDDFRELINKLQFVIDDAHFVAEDDTGRTYDYSKESFPDTKPPIQAREWLGVKPDFD